MDFYKMAGEQGYCGRKPMSIEDSVLTVSATVSVTRRPRRRPASSHDRDLTDKLWAFGDHLRRCPIKSNFKRGLEDRFTEVLLVVERWTEAMVKELEELREECRKQTQRRGKRGAEDA